MCWRPAGPRPPSLTRPPSASQATLAVAAPTTDMRDLPAGVHPHLVMRALDAQERIFDQALQQLLGSCQGGQVLLRRGRHLLHQLLGAGLQRLHPRHLVGHALHHVGCQVAAAGLPPAWAADAAAGVAHDYAHDRGRCGAQPLLQLWQHARVLLLRAVQQEPGSRERARRASLLGGVQGRRETARCCSCSQRRRRAGPAAWARGRRAARRAHLGCLLAP